MINAFLYELCFNFDCLNTVGFCYLYPFLGVTEVGL